MDILAKGDLAREGRVRPARGHSRDPRSQAKPRPATLFQVPRHVTSLRVQPPHVGSLQVFKEKQQSQSHWGWLLREKKSSGPNTIT